MRIQTYARCLLSLCLLVGLHAITGCSSSSNGGGSTAPAPTPDFTITVNQSSLTLNQGGPSGAVTVTVSSSYMFTGTVTLAVAGLPAGVTSTLSATALTAASSSTLTLTALTAATLASGQSFTIQGTSGTLSHSVSVSLTVLGSQGFTLSAPSSLTLSPGISASLPVTVTGVNGFTGPVSIALSGLPSGITTYTPTLSGSPGSTSTFTLNTATGTVFSGPVTITATSGSLSSSVKTTLNVNTTPDFLPPSASFYADNGTTSTQFLQVTGYNGFSAPVSVSFGPLPAGVTITPASLTLTPGVATNVTVLVPFNTAPGQLTIPVQSTSGALSHSSTVTLNVLQNALYVTAPSSVSVHAGSSAAVSVLIHTAANGGSFGSFTLTPSSIPAGYTVTPSQATFSAEAAQTFNIQASASAQSGTLTFKGTWNTLATTGQTGVTVLPASVNIITAVKSRNAYARSDSTAQYLSFPPPNWSLYDSSTGRFFASDYGTSRVSVFDSATRKLISSIAVPGAFGLGQVSGQGSIYAGTSGGDIYVIDPVAMTVSRRIPSSSIGPSGFAANAAYPRPDGSFLLESYFLVPGYSWVDAYNQFALWTPSTNALTLLPKCSNGPGSGGVTFGFPTNNGARLLTVPQLLSPATTLLCSQDLSTGKIITLAAAVGTPINRYLTTLTVSPDGKTIAGFDGANIEVIDAATLTVKSTFAASSSSSLADNPSLFIGPDNQTVYLTGSDNGEHVLVYNMTSGQLTGWMPSVQINQQGGYTPSVPIIQGLSANGLLGGVMEQGFGFLDTSAVNPLPVGTALGTATLQTTYGPPAGGTPTSWIQASQGTTTNTFSLGSTYFGSGAATGLSITGSSFFATSPAGPAGPVDVVTVTTDGGEQLLPEAFSYGPYVLEAPTTYATADGGGPAQIYGYGFGPSYIPNLATQIVAPSADLQVLAGGNSAKVTGYLPGPFSGFNYYNLPFPLVGAEYTVPAGIAGTSVPITVTNSTGATTAAQKLTYLPAMVGYPLTGASLIDGVYDSTRDVYYFTDATQVRVFSRTQGKWLASIPVPLPAIPYGPERLRGIALSPDHSKLVVSDSGAIAIDLIDLANGNTVKSYGLAKTSPAPSGLNTITPAGVAVTNSGKMFFDDYDQNGDGAYFLYTVDPATGNYAPTGSYPPIPGTQLPIGPIGFEQNEGNYPYARLVMSPDGSTIYFANEGQIGALNTATGLGTNYCTACVYTDDGGFDLTLGSDGVTLFADGLLLDTGLQVHSGLSLNWREIPDADYIYGAALSADNKLLFQPGSQFVDVFDTRTGNFLERVSLGAPLNDQYRALIADGKDNVLLAITGDPGAGIAVLDFTSLPAAVSLPFAEQPMPDPLLTNAASPALPVAAAAVQPSSTRPTRSLRSQRFHPGLIPPVATPTVPENAAPQALDHLPARNGLKTVLN